MNKPRFLSLLIFIIFLQASANAQENRVLYTIQIDNKKPLSEVLEQIQSTYGLQFAYDSQLLDTIIIPSQQIQQHDLDKFIQVLLASSDLVYKKEGNQFLLRKENKTKRPSVFGQVLSSDGSPLAFASLQIQNTDWGCSANEYGEFLLEIPTPAIDHFYLEIRYLGYQSILAPISKLKYNTAHQFILRQKEEFIEGMIIEDQASHSYLHSYVSDNHYSIDSLPSDRARQINGDIIQQVRLSGGITAHKDHSSGIQIRGGDTDESLISLDGITLWNTQHMVGIFSNINSQYIDDFQVYKTVYPAIYGGKTSGVVAFETQNILQSDFRSQATIGLLTSDLITTIPLAKNVKILLSGRKTTSDIVSNPAYSALVQEDRKPKVNYRNGGDYISNAIQPTYAFQDYFGKLSWQINSKNQIQASYFLAEDQYQYSAGEQLQRGKINGVQSININEFNAESGNWTNLGFSIQHLGEWSSQKLLKTIYSESRLNSDTDFTNHFSFEVPGVKQIVKENKQARFNSIESRKLQSEAEIVHRTTEKMSLGFDIEQLKSTSNILPSISNQKANLYALLAEYHKRINDHLSIYSGFRLSHFSLTSGIFFSPRIQMTYQINPTLSTSLGYGKYNQFAQLIQNEDISGKSSPFWVLANEQTIPLSKSNQWSTNLQWSDKNWSLKLEAFHKTVSNTSQNLLVEFQLDQGLPNALPRGQNVLFLGDDKINGVDIQLGFKSKHFQASTSYTLSKKTNAITAFNKTLLLPSMDDSRHQGNVIIDYLPTSKIKFYGAFIFASGNPYIDLTNANLTNVGIRNSEKFVDQLSYLPNYNRFDIGAAYLFTFNKVRLELGGNVFNLFNTQNIEYIQYGSKPNVNDNRSQVVATEIHQLGNTPNIYLTVKF